MTQEKLAELSGLDRSEISHIETGDNQATSANIIRRLAAAFKIGMPDMMSVLDGTLGVESAYHMRKQEQ